MPPVHLFKNDHLQKCFQKYLELKKKRFLEDIFDFQPSQKKLGVSKSNFFSSGKLKKMSSSKWIKSSLNA